MITSRSIESNNESFVKTVPSIRSTDKSTTPDAHPKILINLTDDKKILNSFRNIMAPIKVNSPVNTNVTTLNTSMGLRKLKSNQADHVVGEKKVLRIMKHTKSNQMPKPNSSLSIKNAENATNTLKVDTRKFKTTVMKNG